MTAQSKDAGPQKVVDLRIGPAHLKMNVASWPTGAFRIRQSHIVEISPALRHLIGREVRIVGVLSREAASGDSVIRSGCIEEA